MVVPCFLLPTLATFLLFPYFSLSLSMVDRMDSVEEDTGDGSGGVGRQVGGLRRGPLVPLCAQTEPMNLC